MYLYIPNLHEVILSKRAFQLLDIAERPSYPFSVGPFFSTVKATFGGYLNVKSCSYLENSQFTYRLY